MKILANGLIKQKQKRKKTRQQLPKICVVGKFHQHPIYHSQLTKKC